MSKDKKALVVRGDRKGELAPRRDAALVAQKNELKLKAAERGIEATAEIAKLLVRGGNVFLDAQERRDITAKEWEDTRRRIAELDATTEAELRKLAAQLEQHKEKTTRLRMVLDVVASKGEVLPIVLSKGLAKAIEQLTEE